MLRHDLRHDWLFLFLLLLQTLKEVVAFEIDLAPPRCAWAIFVHTPKTGGTHLRTTFTGQCCDANKALWNSTDWAWHMRKHVRQAEADPQYLVDWLHESGGRVFSEAHLPQDLTKTITTLREVERSEVWQRSGCRLWIFTMVRNPNMFLRSNVHEAFQHSIYRQTFIDRFGKDIRYSDDGSHHAISTYGADLVDLQVQEVANMLTLDECVADDTDAPGSITAQFSCILSVINQMDFIGLTEHMPLTLIALQTVLGLHEFPPRAVNCNANAHAWRNQTEAAAMKAREEDVALRDISLQSEHDWALYNHAKDVFATFLQEQVPDSHARLAAFLEMYGDTACTDGSFDAEHIFDAGNE